MRNPSWREGFSFLEFLDPPHPVKLVTFRLDKVDFPPTSRECVAEGLAIIERMLWKFIKAVYMEISNKWSEIEKTQFLRNFWANCQETSFFKGFYSFNNSISAGTSQCFIASPPIYGVGSWIFEKLAPPPHFRKWGGRAPSIFEKDEGANFLKMWGCRFGGYFQGVFSLSISRNPQNFLARASGARESLIYLFDSRRAQKQRIREPVRLALCSFGPSTAVLAAYRALNFAYDGSATHTSSSCAARTCKRAHTIMHLA